MISIIAAASLNLVIGKNNDLPWKISNDLKRFKDLTTGHHVIMGRKTFESLGRPLPKRINIVITRNKEIINSEVIVVNSLAAALNKARLDSEIFIIGGGEIYKQALPIADKIYLTKVLDVVDGDTYFPEIDDNWKLVEHTDTMVDSKSMVSYKFETYIRS